MASPLLPYVTLRLLSVPKHKTKRDIAALFEPDDSKNILRISLGEAVLPSATPSRVATVTFASNSQALDNFLEAGHIIEDDVPNQPPTFGSRICLDINHFGFTPLNIPVNVEKSVDLVAITGLAGQAFVSWQNVKGDMWLRDYLPYDIPSLRVFTYGFQSELWMSTSTATLADYSDIFLDHLRNCLDIGRTRPLILMGHSIGGMIIKSTLIKLSTSTSTDDYKLYKSICAMYFFGTPHRGLNNEALLKVYSNKYPGPIIRDLGVGSTVLSELSESWIQASKNIKVVTCFELRVTPTSRLAADEPTSKPKRDGDPVMMVTRESACFYSENETRIPINHNHSMIAKLNNQPGSEYHAIARTLKRHVQEELDKRDRGKFIWRLCFWQS